MIEALNYFFSSLSPEMITIIMFGSIFVGILTGFPLAVPIGAVRCNYGIFPVRAQGI